MDVAELARRFAESLDGEDYEAARRCLSPRAEYVISGDVHSGPDAILASYRASGDWAARAIDRIAYESRVNATGPRTAVISFTDRIEHAGEKLVHRCEQRLEFDDDGAIRRITHVDLPGEPEALAAYFQRVGLSRPKGAGEKEA